MRHRHPSLLVVAGVAGIAGVVATTAACGGSTAAKTAAPPPAVTRTVVVTTSTTTVTSTAPPVPTVTSTVTARPAPTSIPTGAASSGAGAGNQAPNYVVGAYFDAINQHDYRTAWSLGGDHLSPDYTAFANGFADTTRDDLRILSVNGNVVSVRFNANHSNGTATIYQGTYTVQGGQIVAANLAQVGTLP